MYKIINVNIIIACIFLKFVLHAKARSCTENLTYVPNNTIYDDDSGSILFSKLYNNFENNWKNCSMECCLDDSCNVVSITLFPGTDYFECNGLSCSTCTFQEGNGFSIFFNATYDNAGFSELSQNYININQNTLNSLVGSELLDVFSRSNVKTTTSTTRHTTEQNQETTISNIFLFQDKENSSNETIPFFKQYNINTNPILPLIIISIVFLSVSIITLAMFLIRKFLNSMDKDVRYQNLKSTFDLHESINDSDIEESPIKKKINFRHNEENVQSEENVNLLDEEITKYESKMFDKEENA
ncbi:hypothetical protein A3Q56_01697 [Intoshia linei]|uniref:Seven cysteines N-terminal domain-containing protein n=1 Tax=Intoshia linei TaxID=1819745 RepID=A0A177BA72_9BILA|nr:hypothetical protein A3Q56_01697 [Intoshia linei]